MTMDPGSGAPMADRMQSLLSQAVEDQRSEQRQIAVALTEVRGQLARITGEIETLRSAPGGGGGGVSAEEAVATVARDVREAVRMLAERLDAVGRSVQERGADIAEMKVAIEDLHSAVRGHTNALAGVNQALAAVPAVGERVGGLQDNLVGLHERLAGLEEVAASVDRLGLRIESADQDMRELRSAFTGMASRMAELPGRGDLTAAGAQTAESLDLVAGRLARVESAIPELLARIDAVREHVLSMSAGGEAVTGTGAGAGGRVDDGVAERLDAVEAALVMLTEQLTSEAGAAEPAEAADEGPDPLAEQLADLHEGLFGEDGIAARLEGVAVDEDALNERVATAVAESERRLSAHMDEAVLALAEALFKSRRRPGRPAAAVPPPVPAPVPPVPVPAPVVDETDEEYDDEPEQEDDEAAGLDVEAEDFAEDEDEGEDEGDDPGDGEPEPEPAAAVLAPAPAVAPPWQMPVPQPPAPAADVPAAEEESKARRRPWWRPGD